MSMSDRQIEMFVNQLYGKDATMAVKTKTKKKGNKWDEVPEPSLGLEGNILYDFTISGCEKTHTNAEPQRKMFKIELEVEAPEEHKGRKHTEFFTIGTPDDTEGDELATLKKSFGAQAFKKMSTAAGVGMLDDDDDMLEALKDEKVSGIITVRTDAKTGDSRAGVRPTNWFPIGENEPGPVDGTAGTKAKSKRGKVAAKKKTKTEDEEEDETDDEESDDEEEPPKKKSKSKSKDDDDDDDDSEDEEDEPAPKKKKKPVKEEEESDDDESDDDEEEDERPARKRSKK